MKQAIVAFIVKYLLISPCLACFTTPPEQVVSPSDLVKRSNTIVLAKATEARLDLESGLVTYSFILIKKIKGSPPVELKISGGAMEEEKNLSTFENHKDETFWTSEGGRSRHDEDCKIHPAFSVGSTYLLFLDQPFHRKSFERIIHHEGDEIDKWLAWVKEEIKVQSASGSVPNSKH